MPSTVISAAHRGFVFHFAGFQRNLHRGGVRLVLEHQPAERPREKLQCLGVELAGVDRLQTIAVGELQLIGLDGPQRHQPPRIARNAEPQRHQLVHGDTLADERPRASGRDGQPQRLFRGKPAGQADVHAAAVPRQAVFVVIPVVDGPGRHRLDGVDLPALRHLRLDRKAGGGGHAEIGGNSRGRLAAPSTSAVPLASCTAAGRRAKYTCTPASGVKYWNWADSPARGAGSGLVPDCRPSTAAICLATKGAAIDTVAIPSCQRIRSGRIRGSVQRRSVSSGAQAVSFSSRPSSGTGGSARATLVSASPAGEMIDHGTGASP